MKSGKTGLRLFFLQGLRSISLLLIFISAIDSGAQTHPYINYTTKDGLCNMDINCIHQDKKGFMWFATSYGLSIFDGHTFQNYFDSDGLLTNDIIQIAESSDSTLYFASSRNGKAINILKNGKFEYFTIDENIKGIYRMQMRNDTLFIREDSGILSYIANNKYKRYLSDDLMKQISDSLEMWLFFFGSDNNIFVYGAGGIYKINNHKLEKINIDGLKDKTILTIAEDKDKNLWIGTIKNVYVINNFKVIRKIEFKENDFINQIFTDSRGIAWFGVSNKELYYYKDGKLSNIGQKFNSKGLRVLQFYEDNQRNVWISIKGKGLYCFNNIFVTKYNEADGLTNNYVNDILINNDGKVIIGTQNGLNIYDNEKFNQVSSGLTFVPAEWICDLKKGLNNNYTVCLIGTGRNFPVFSKEAFNMNFIFGMGLGGYQADSLTYLFGNNYEIDVLRKTNNNFIKTDSIFIFDNKIRSGRIGALEIQSGRDNALWIGTTEGLVYYNGKEKKYFDYDSVLKGSISSVKKDGENRVWAAGSNGISIILPDGKIISYGRLSDWDFRMSNALAFDNSKNVWVGNIKGLYRISIDSIPEGKISGYFFNENNGLPANSITCIEYDEHKNELWAGTGNGLARIELDEMDKYIVPPSKVIIKNFQLRDTTIINCNNLVLNSSQNNIIINYSSPNYYAPANIKYEYKIGSHNLSNINWIHTASSSIELASLPSGEYNFMIRALDNNSKSEITNISFVIKPPFRKTIWFYVIIIILIILFTGFVFDRRIKYIKRKSQEKLNTEKSISELKHRALSASLNPHFIFNTLNSIQQYNSMHTKEEANEYLVNFSRLIRMNLDLADKTFIPLETELIRLELYLKYEKIRFGDRLEYIIKTGTRINPEKLLIPNMILQPFVENSIWHGILPKKEGGNINIEINIKEKEIKNKVYKAVEITIADDGIGLNEANKHEKSKHISKGISLIEERLNLLSPDIKGFRYIEMQNRKDIKSGTTVTLVLLPGQYKTDEQPTQQI